MALHCELQCSSSLWCQTNGANVPRNVRDCKCASQFSSLSSHTQQANQLLHKFLTTVKTDQYFDSSIDSRQCTDTYYGHKRTQDSVAETVGDVYVSARCPCVRRNVNRIGERLLLSLALSLYHFFLKRESCTMPAA